MRAYFDGRARNRAAGETATPVTSDPDIDLRLLRVFVAVAEARGFAAAESHLKISSSTISVHMTKLEGRLGIRLCERGRGGFKLTERGRVVYQESKKILRALDDFAGTLASVRTRLAGRLSVGMVDALVMHPEFPISDAIREFNTVSNEVQFDIRVASRQELEHDVFEGSLHAAFGPFIRNVSGLKFTPLFREPQDLYCGQGHPLFEAPPQVHESANLSNYRAVIRLYHDEFDRGKLGVVREAAWVSSMDAMLALILSGDYIGYLPRFYAKSWISEGRLARIEQPGISYDSEHGILTRPGEGTPVVLTKFLGLVRDASVRRREARRRDEEDD